GELLWSREAKPQEVSRFFRAFEELGNPKLAIYGHTIVKKGFQKIPPNQMILSSSFGMKRKKKKYLLLSLEKEYSSIEDLEEGKEILPLYED
ncbi:MAG: hypothetical protein D6785_12830, partial [Planctomycetota bacterium]